MNNALLYLPYAFYVDIKKTHLVFMFFFSLCLDFFICHTKGLHLFLFFFFAILSSKLKPSIHLISYLLKDILYLSIILIASALYSGKFLTLAYLPAYLGNIIFTILRFHFRKKTLVYN